MRYRKLSIWCIFLLVLALLIRVYAASQVRVENQYSNGFYPVFSGFLRHILGWVPFSFGDISYGAAILWLLWKIVRVMRAIWKKQITCQHLISGGLKTIALLLSVYVVFNAFWGINYNRRGIAAQLQLKMDKYSVDDLKNINGVLVAKVNTAKETLLKENAIYPSTGELFLKVQNAYQAVDSLYPFLQYDARSLKPSLWGWMGNYLGFTGYYNPFTGEAQVNTTVPKFLQPFISCHEVAHQLGYAKEMEANFVGYLAASNAKDPLLHYSVYLDLFIYSNRNLYNMDTASAKMYAIQLLPEIKSDLKQWRDFNRRHRNPVEPLVRWMYGKYLEQNEQPQGVLSYDEVTSFLIAYYKKFGKI